MRSRVMKQRITEQQEVTDKTFYFLKCLSMEMTRKCNMKCRFCARGDAQCIDMSKEVIDKTLDELEFFDLHTLRLNGGEPFLAKDGIIYLANEIVRRGIRLYRVGLFTNGTVKDPDIKSALLRLGQHCKKMCQTAWGKRMGEIAKEYDLQAMYDNDTYINIIVSTSLHDNSDLIDDVVDFYNENTDFEILHAVNQDKSYKGFNDTVQIKESEFDVTINLRGNAIKNFRALYDEGFKQFTIHENDFALIGDWGINKGYTIISKTISISATGAVFPGCLQPYAEIDSGKNIICDNILNCNGDLFKYISDYSWEYPLNEDQSEKLDTWKTILLYYEHDILDCYLSNVPLNEDIIRTVVINIALMAEFETGLKELHKLFPTTTHSELNLLGAVKYAYHTEDPDLRKYILTNICGLELGENSVLHDYSTETLEKILDDYEEIYYSRQNEFFGNPLPSDALIAKATKDAIIGVIKGWQKKIEEYRKPYEWMQRGFKP